tara:strand:+ start:346 stop:555 length:210 start_codon:yes stop_codon:yes gene_type:complete
MLSVNGTANSNLGSAAAAIVVADNKTIEIKSFSLGAMIATPGKRKRYRIRDIERSFRASVSVVMLVVHQ